jgi:predicted pyridoxine 5'-phosphate oxidase superfamily flavin-nucleotide-binding protein
MGTSHTYSSDIAFTSSIKAVQTRKGSRQAYRRVEERGSWPTQITPDLAAFIEAQTSVFLATVSAEGQPYVQHRGGPAGFLRVLDDKTIGFVDFSGNRQYITQGNLLESQGPPLLDRLCSPASHQDLGRGARHRRRRGVDYEADAGRLQGAPSASDPLHHFCLGRELRSAYSTAL